MATLEEDLERIRSFSSSQTKLGNLPLYRQYIPPSKTAIAEPEPATRVLDSLAADAEDREAGRLQSAAGGFVKGAGDIFTSVPKAFGESYRIWDASEADTEEEARRRIQDPNWLDKLGKIGDEFFSDITDINPEYQEETLQKFSTALGSAAGFLAGGAVGAITKKIPTYLLPAFLGATSTGVHGVDDYRRTIEAQGGILKPSDEAKTFALNSLIGTSEALVYTHALGRLNNLSGGAVGKIVTGGGKLSPLLGKVLATKPGRVAAAGFVGGLEELTQEVLSQLGTNYVANGIVKYDPDRELFEGAQEAGAYGFSVGATLNVLLQSIFGRKGRFSSRADIEARAKNDLQGLGLDEDIYNAATKDADGNTIRPLDQAKRPFDDPNAQRLLERYLVLARARGLQEGKELDTAKLDENIETLITDLRRTLNPEEGGKPLQGLKREEYDEVSQFIDIAELQHSLERKKKESDAEEAKRLQELQDTLKSVIVEDLTPERITLKPLTKERVKSISVENRKAIEALHKQIAANAAAKGFDINKTLEEIEITPLEIIEQQEEDEIVLENPLVQELKDKYGISDIDIALGNIPTEPVSDIEISTLSLSRIKEIDAVKAGLIDRVRQEQDLPGNEIAEISNAILDSDFSGVEQSEASDFYKSLHDEIFKDESELSEIRDIALAKTGLRETTLERARLRYPNESDEQIYRRLLDEKSVRAGELEGVEKDIAKREIDDLSVRIRTLETERLRRDEEVQRTAKAEAELAAAPSTRTDEVELLINSVRSNEIIPENLKAPLIESIRNNKPLDFDESGLPKNIQDEIFSYQAQNDQINTAPIEIDTTQDISSEQRQALNEEILQPIQRSTRLNEIEQRIAAKLAEIAEIETRLATARKKKKGGVGVVATELRKAKEELRDLKESGEQLAKPVDIERLPSILTEEGVKARLDLLRELQGKGKQTKEKKTKPRKEPVTKRRKATVDPSIVNPIDAENLKPKKSRGKRRITPTRIQQPTVDNADASSVINTPMTEEAARIDAGISVTTVPETTVPEEIANKTYRDPRVAEAELESAGLAGKTHLEETPEGLVVKPNEVPVFDKEVNSRIDAIEEELIVLGDKVIIAERALRVNSRSLQMRKQLEDSGKRIATLEAELRKLRNEPDQIPQNELEFKPVKTPVKVEYSEIEKAVGLWEDFVSGKGRSEVEQRIVNDYGSTQALHDFILKARKGEIVVERSGKQLTETERKVLMDHLAKVEKDDATADLIRIDTEVELNNAVLADDSIGVENRAEELKAAKEEANRRLQRAKDNAAKQVLPEDLQARKRDLQAELSRIDTRLLFIDPDLNPYLDDRYVDEFLRLESRRNRVAAELETLGVKVDARPDASDPFEMPYEKDMVPEGGKTRITRTGPISLRSMLVNHTDQRMLDEQQKQVENFIARMTPEARALLEVKFIRDLEQLDPVADAALIRYINRRGSLPNGVFFAAGKFGGQKGKAYVFGQIAGNNSVKVLMHEVVGHFGMRTLFGEGWDNFLSKVYMNDSRMAVNVYEYTNERWKRLLNVDPEFKSGRYNIRLTNGDTVTVSNDAMRALTEEYIADIAKRFADPNYRAKMAKSELSLIRRVFAIIKHLMKKIGFGIYSDTVTNEDLASLLSESYTRIFQDPVLNYSVTKDVPYLRKLRELGLKQNPEVDIPAPIPYSNSLSSFQMQDLLPGREVYGYDTLPLVTVEEEERLVLADEPLELVKQMNVNDADIAAVQRLMDSNFASTNTSAYQQWLTGIGTAIENSPALQHLNPLGKLELQRAYIRLLNEQSGKIHLLGTVFPERLHKAYAELNNVQQEAVFEYFTTKGADKNLLPVNQEIRDLSETAKEMIVELGRNAKDMGLLAEASFIKNQDSYLPRVYLKYLAEGKGSGRSVSFLNYLKHEKNLPQDIRNALEAGRLKNPAIIIPDTIATIARDQAILRFFDNLTEATRELGVDWVLRKEFEIQVNGKTWYIPNAKEHVEDIKNELAQSPPMPLVQIEYRQSQIQLFEQAIEAGEQAANTTINAKALDKGFATAKQFLDTNYEQLPNTKRYGKLRNAHIRKEIYNDIKDAFEIFDPKNQDKAYNKWFGPHGILIRLHSHWKGIKVLGNVPSWFRNGFGNLALLDISSRRNSLVLSRWVMQEAVALARYETGLAPKSKWMDIAFDNGAFASTYANQELVLIREKFLKSLQPPPSGLFGRFFPGMSEGYFQTMQFLSHRYGDMEGIFKTVRIKDHIIEWEEQSGRSFDALQGAERKAVIDEAVYQANQAIFDYGKVTNFVRQFRKYPLGSPFLTFTIKAFPQVIRSFVRRPQKFIKYMLLPMVLHQMFLMTNDLDDDDYEQIQRDMPLKIQELSSVILLPLRDENGRFQYMPMDYFLPWAPWLNAGLHISKNIETSTTAGMLDSTFTGILKTLMEPLGFLGGPIPQAITAWKTGIDPFTHRPIVTEGASPIRKLNERMTYAWGVAMPSWLTNYGFLGKLLDDSGISVLPGGRAEQVDRFGRDKETGFQVGSRLFGLNVSPINREVNLRNNRAKFERDIRVLETARRKLLAERMPAQDKASELRDINLRIRETRKKMARVLYGR